MAGYPGLGTGHLWTWREGNSEWTRGCAPHDTEVTNQNKTKQRHVNQRATCENAELQCGGAISLSFFLFSTFRNA